MPDQDSTNCLDLDSMPDTVLAIYLRLRYGETVWDPRRTTRWCDKLGLVSDFSNIPVSKIESHPFQFYYHRTAYMHMASRRDPKLLIPSDLLSLPVHKWLHKTILDTQQISTLLHLKLRLYYTYLISVDKYYFFNVQREQHVKEQDLVSPNGSLFLGLLMKPTRPFVLHKLIFKAIFFSHMRQKILSWKR